MKIQKHLLLLLLLAFNSFLTAQVVINEYSASNLRSYIDNFQESEDWVELYNTSNQMTDLSGWYLSDKADNPQKWEIPTGTTIEGNDYLVFWLSGRDTVVGNNIHTNFKLTQTKGEDFLVLSNPSGNIANSFALDITLQEHSRCRETDGGLNWMICTTPTLGASNEGSTQYMNYTSEPAVGTLGGFYTGEQAIIIQSAEPNVVIHYTTDGKIPTETSPVYTDPIIVTETQVIKARSFSSDTLIAPGKVAFNTYFIDEDFTLAVFSVAADSLTMLANGQGDIRPIGTVEYFDKNKVRKAVSYGELNRHGQDSWALPHRSLDWISRDEMGYSHAVKTELFSYSDRDEYQRFMFRASGDDNYPAVNDNAHQGSAHVRDEYVHTLAYNGGMELDVRAVERVIVYLNGQYWGVYGLRERPVDHDYTSYYYDQGKFDVHFLNTWGSTWAEYGGQASFDDWEEIRDFILDNDMSDSTNYEMVKDRINLLSMIDYMIANLNSVASDWMNYNTGFWRGTNPDGKHKKWGYILWDNDATFDYYINYSGVPNTDPDAEPCDIEDISDYMDQFFSYSWTGEDIGKHDKLFLKLQEENEEFKQLYYSRQADLMNTVYTCENMLSLLDTMIGVIAPEMPRQISRWGGSMSEWQDNVDDLRSFIEERCTLLDDGMINCFDLEGPYPITLMVEPANIGVGEIDFNTLDIEEFPWTGNYFGGMENLIKAKSFLPEFEFSHWESKSGNTIFPDSLTRRATITLTQADTLIAHFALPTATSEPTSNFSFMAYPTLVENHLNVAFELDEAMNVNLSLYSVTGNQITSFDKIDGRRAAGEYREQLDLSTLNIPAGLYFLNFQAGNNQKTVKVSILK
jgi:CotH protein/lamin tail-like protein/chitobiase/beta-hexosaminidase-like protein/type IX secretion system substrate protein